MSRVLLILLLASFAACHRERRPPPPNRRGHDGAPTARTFEEQPGDVTVYREPPTPRAENPEPCPGDKADWCWIPGHWASYGGWRWIEGHWHRVPKGRRAWVPGKWRYEREQGAWVWLGGRWE